MDCNYILEDDSKFKINIDEYDLHANVFISKHHIKAYLNLMEKFNQNVCGIGMADIEDVKLATKGILTEHIMLKIVSDDENVDSITVSQQYYNVDNANIILLDKNEIIDFIYNKKTIMPQRIKMWL